MISVRKMQAVDVEAVSQIEAAVFSQPWSVQGFLDALSLENTIFLVAEENKKILGYVGMYVSLDEGEITNVAVTPEARRRGVGQSLIEKIKKEAEANSVLQMILEVRVSNDPAIRLYQRNGFLNCGIRKGFYDFPKEDAYIMIYRKDVELLTKDFH
ncbi:MAG: ribosomal protein S18-alanine N-acetyltransferase [Roseburia sp.]|nr:ribosomal protein S18-alanine N-acetyltransferase [Roseburia sp.]